MKPFLTGPLDCTVVDGSVYLLWGVPTNKSSRSVLRSISRLRPMPLDHYILGCTIYFVEALRLTPNPMMIRNILKKTRKTWLAANAIGMIPRNVVAAPTTTDGPISPSPSAIRTSLSLLGSCNIFFGIEQWGWGTGRGDATPRSFVGVQFVRRSILLDALMNVSRQPFRVSSSRLSSS